VQSRVEPFHQLGFEWSAFANLSTDRPVAFDRGQIPWSSIDAYAARYGLVFDDFDRFVRLVRAMDAAYLAWFKTPEQKDD